MKKILALFATIFPLSASLLPLHAQAIFNPGEHNNKVTVVAEDADADIEKFPLEIHLSNPTTGIGGISSYLYFDDNTVRPWIWDEDEESYSYDTNTKRCYKTATVNIWLADEDNQKFPGYFYVNVFDSRDFKLNDGNIITIYIDGTKLSDGKHILHVLEPMCSYANADGSESATYFCTPHDIEFNVGQGVITIADAIKNIHVNSPSLPCTYDLQGRRLAQPSVQGISIIDGRKVIR